MPKQFFLILSLALVVNAQPTFANTECVVLLHGLARSADSMNKLEAVLSKERFFVANIDYPSREKEVAELAAIAVEAGLAECPSGYSKVHFVTHSLGGILVRYYAKHNEINHLGRVVMIGPPNQGSQVVDNYKNVPGYSLINGPAGLQLGTDDASIPANLGPVQFELGVIAGTRTFNPILSQSLPNPDDGKVSVENTKVEGMKDFLQVPHTHTFMMRAEVVIQQTLRFLKKGSFLHESNKPIKTSGKLNVQPNPL